ncbi:DUF1493 family protein [Paraburkholderia sp. MMS20-SJTR3]|uniref:DUF1493 family protein n=1 Tax=Paraburkholderia sejongensis TaxID=2886946 RepID=A0ABS8JX73_9BURK|nr:DUF1493 family protein [Paraburkholderia sp. MMS20-SJTR3]MCC8394333.1 DUF1493 family protein [Paraburkholderia sp. MMS20-SJTR3]
MNDTWPDLEQFIREMRGPSLFSLDEELSREMDLYHDLDWEPPRIVEVMQAWAERFQVDLRDFDVSYYVPTASMRKRDAVAAALKSPFSATARELFEGPRTHARHARRSNAARRMAARLTTSRSTHLPPPRSCAYSCNASSTRSNSNDLS